MKILALADTHLRAASDHRRDHVTDQERWGRLGTHCKYGHEYVEGSFRLNNRGARLCTICAKAHHAAWRAANPERVRAMRRRAERKRAEAIRAFEKTPAQRARRSAAKRRLRQDPDWRAKEQERMRRYREAWTPEVKKARHAYVAQWRRDNRERVRELNRIRRARQNGAVGAEYVTPEKLRARREFYGARCFYCGIENVSSMDHRIPITRGGSEFPSNQVPCCKSCNSRKGTKKPSEWLATAT